MNKHIISFDIASEVSSSCVMSESGHVSQETNIITAAKPLKALVKSVPRPRIVVFEECCQSDWLYSIFEPIADDVIVCDPRKNKNLSGHKKTDKNDAFSLADRARGGHLTRVWHGGRAVAELRESLRLYQSLTKDSTMLKNQISAVFRSRGIHGASKAYNRTTRFETLKQLPLRSHQLRVKLLGDALDNLTPLRERAQKRFLGLAAKSSMYKPLKAIDGIGKIYAATIIAEIGTPHRFRNRHTFWSYCGFAITTHETAEYKVDKRGRIIHKQKPIKTRGLVHHYNRTLKCVFKQGALILSRTKWSGEYERLRKSGVNHSNALLTLARKLSAVTLNIAKTEKPYDIALVFAK